MAKKSPRGVPVSPFPYSLPCHISPYVATTAAHPHTGSRSLCWTSHLFATGHPAASLPPPSHSPHATRAIFPRNKCTRHSLLKTFHWCPPPSGWKSTTSHASGDLSGFGLCQQLQAHLCHPPYMLDPTPRPTVPEHTRLALWMGPGASSPSVG